MARYFDKLGFQMWMQNPAFMRLPREYRGCWLDLRMMSGSDESERGYIPIGSVKKAKFDDVVDFLCMGEDEGRAHYRKIVRALLMSGALEELPSGPIRIGRYEEEQALGKSDGTYRGRKHLDKKLVERIKKSPGYVKGLFKRCGAEALPKDVVIGELKKRNRCNSNTAETIFIALRGDGCLCVSSEGVCSLASLAPPSVSGSVSGRETYTPCKFNVDKDKETEIRDSNESPIESTDARAPGTGLREGGASEARQGAPVGRGRDGPPMLREGEEAPGILPREPEPPEIHFDDDGLLYSPEDVWNVKDPLLATEILLRIKPGWNDVQKPGKPPSTFTLRKKFTDAMDAAGRDDGIMIWRKALFELYLEHLGDNQNIFSWVSLFQSKVNKAVLEKYGIDLRAVRASG
jgi:hypothetical protein